MDAAICRVPHAETRPALSVCLSVSHTPSALPLVTPACSLCPRIYCRFALFIHWFCFFRLHTYVGSYGICLPLPGLLQTGMIFRIVHPVIDSSPLWAPLCLWSTDMSPS